MMMIEDSKGCARRGETRDDQRIPLQYADLIQSPRVAREDGSVRKDTGDNVNTLLCAVM